MLTSFFSTNKNVATFFSWWETKEGVFFCKPPAFHRLLFMSPFAGDIRAEPGSLKWIAQIPRKACRWALKGDSKKVFWAWMWDIFFVGLLIFFFTKHEQLEQLHFCLCKKRPRKKKKQFGRGIHFCWFALQNFFTRWGRCRPKIAHPKSNLAVAKERSAKVGLCKPAPAKHTSTFL